MRFGAFTPQGWRWDLAGIPVKDHWPTMLGVARRIEELGFESVWVYDHFHNSPPSPWMEWVHSDDRKTGTTYEDWVESMPDSYTVPVATQEATHEAWSLMAALAASTERARLGQMCTCNAYRPPAYLAKVAATIDVISGGRLEMGIGAGWYQAEFLGYGYEFPRPAVRIGQLDEAVQIMRRLWSEDVVDFDGEHYRLQGAICRPQPLQQPHIPLWIAGGGEQLTLRVAARYADYTNFGGRDIATFSHKSRVLADHCAAVGRDFETITRTVNMNLVCGEDQDHVEAQLGRLRRLMLAYAPEERVERELALYRRGTPEQLVEELEAWSAAGMAYLIIYFPGLAHDLSGLKLFAEQVIPALS